MSPHFPRTGGVLASTAALASAAALASGGVLASGMLLGCGGDASLTPELIARQTFDLLKADKFSTYFTTLAANTAIVTPLCPGLAGLTRYFESGEGAEGPQNDRWVECRAAVDFSKATFVRSTVTPKANSTLVPPSCAQPLIQVDARVEVNVAGKAATFTVADITQFDSGWRAYGRLKNCSTAP